MIHRKNKPKLYVTKENRFIKENALRIGDGEIAKLLTKLTGRPWTRNAVTQRRKYMGIKKQKGPGAPKEKRPPAAVLENLNSDLFAAAVPPEGVEDTKGPEKA